jgi:DNA-binding GntR family transcriptional regulator
MPLYRRISKTLIESITGGAFPVGSLLPTEQELCAQYGVSRYTVREALRVVEALGMVTRRQGQGTQVCATRERRSFKLALRTFTDIEQHGYFTCLTDIQTEDVRADAALAGELPCAVGDAFIRICCYREPVDESVPVPTAWNETYIIAAYASVARDLGQHPGPIYGQIERTFDESIREIEQEVSAILLDPVIAGKLSVKPRSPGLRVKRTYVGRSGKPVMFAWNTYSGDHFNLTMRLRQE